ncbi:MAG: hypothetical protein ACYC9O_07265 [Candidatus Latescibacterota bacterium]
MNAIPRTTRALIAFLAGILLFSGSVAAAEPPARIRIGTFDSRFVALAYYRSDGMKTIREFRTKLEEELLKAREANDEKKVKALEAQGPALQNLLHQQVFGNLSIPNVMRTIADRLPEIAKKNGVTLIVSKWDIPYSAGIEPVDLTIQMVGLFPIDDETKKMIENGLKDNRDPVPVEKLLNPYD